MIVNVYNNQEDLKIAEEAVPPIVELVLNGEGLLGDEVSVTFLTKEMSGKIHRDYFNDPSPTDCMTFPLHEPGEPTPYRCLGDLFICPAIGMEYDKEDPYKEVTLYLIHCLLHLSGFGDISDEEVKEMREAEALYLEQVKKLDLWLRP